MTTPLVLFEEHLQILRDRGHVVRDALWLVEALRTRTLIPPRTVVITFDDGLSDLHDIAAPALARFGYCATAFAIGAALRGDIGRLPRAWPGGYMTVEQARELQRDGLITFGAHGLTHHALTGMETDRLREEISGARNVLSDLLGADVKLYAYPRGGPGTWDLTTRAAVAGAGYRGAFTSVTAATRAGTPPFAIPRARISWADDRKSFEMLLSGCYDWYAIVQELQASSRLLRGGY